MHSSGRHQHHSALFLLQQARIHELIGEELVMGVIESSAKFDRARGLIDLVVDGGERAGCNPLGHFAVESIHGQLLSRVLFREHRRQLIFRDSEDDADGLKLYDDEQPGDVRGLDDIAWIHQPQADAAGDGRGDVAVNQIHLHAVDQALIVFHCPFVLFHQRDLRGELLFGNRVLFDEGFVARLIDACIVEQGLIADQLPFVLRQHGLIRPRIDFG